MNCLPVLTFRFDVLTTFELFGTVCGKKMLLLRFCLMLRASLLIKKTKRGYVAYRARGLRSKM